MRNIDKYPVRQMKSEAYINLTRRVKETFTWFMTTPVSILNCLNEARLNEKKAMSAERSREKLRSEVPLADPPPECSGETIAGYYRQAARMYEAAATYAVLQHDLYRAFKRFRKAAKCGGRCEELLSCGDSELLVALEDYRAKTAVIRYEIARRSVRRKKLTLGLSRRLR